MRIVVLFFSIICISSCSSKKSILYLQKDSIEETSADYSVYEHKITPGDILKIDLLSDDYENILNESKIYENQNITRESLILTSYLVDRDGFVKYSNFGKLKVSGLSVDQVENMIEKFYIESDILTNPVFKVSIINKSFTLLGEVNNPGKYYFDEDVLDIFQALGLGGDLTIYGKRDEIKIVRNIGDMHQIINLDLTSKNIINNEDFQVIPGDIIIVNPNTTRVKNAGIIGNSGTLVTLLSFILSSIILTTSN